MWFDLMPNEDKDRVKTIVSAFFGYQDPNRKY